MNNKIYIEERGNLNISEEAISTIVSHTVKEIEGVAGLQHNAYSEIVRFLGRAEHADAIKMEKGHEGLILDVYLRVCYGFRIPDVAVQVQESIKGALETMLQVSVTSINVHVVGIEYAQ